MTSFTDGTPNPVILSAATTPFTAITVNDVPATIETISITLYPEYYYNYYYNGYQNGSYLQSSNFPDVGKISDPNGGGTYNTTTHTFTEQVLVTGTPTEGTKLLQRLVYTPPNLQPGTSNTVSALINVNGFTDPGNPPSPPSGSYSPILTPLGSVLLETVTPPLIAGAIPNIPVATPTTTSPTLVNPFATVQITDSNPSPKLSAVITVTDGGVQTDADGILTGQGISKVVGQAGLYTVSAPYGYLSLQGLTFSPTAVADNTTRTTSFELNVTDSVSPGLSTDDKNTSVIVLGKIVNNPPVPPLIVGTTAIAVVPGNIIQPFSTVTVSDQNANPKDSATITVDVPGGGVLSGPGVGITSPTVYTIPATSPDQLTTILRNINFAPSTPGDPTSVTSHITLDVTNAANLSADGTVGIVELPPPTPTPVPTPTPTPTPSPTPTPTPTAAFTVSNQSNGQTATFPGQPYSGPVPGLTQDIILVTPDNLNVTANIPNVFIKTGSGTDAIDVSKVGGNNVLDGSTGSNFLTGGGGADTFYLDDRNPVADVFSTVVGFHSGDNASVFGVNTSDFTLNELNGQGASGYTGLDFAFSAPGHANANIVLAGFTTSDLSNGRLTVTYGTTPDTPGLPGSQYMNIHAN
jgi:hypothetical protein